MKKLPTTLPMIIYWFLWLGITLKMKLFFLFYVIPGICFSSYIKENGAIHFLYQVQYFHTTFDLFLTILTKN